MQDFFLAISQAANRCAPNNPLISLHFQTLIIAPLEKIRVNRYECEPPARVGRAPSA
jgi:hypothetical protein